MEPDPVNLSDPIAEKLRDTATMERLIRLAVCEAVDKASRLGFIHLSGAEKIALEHRLELSRGA